MPVSKKTSKDEGVLSTLSQFSSQERMIFVMTTLLIAASFFLGYFYGQLTVIKGGGALVAGANGGAAAPTQPAAAPEEVPITEELWKELLVAPAAARGPEDAEVTLVEFTDYQCPFCSRHFSETDPQIKADYIDTGKVRHLIRDLPLPFHTNAHAASQAARCAGDQSKYWEMHDLIFENQETWGNGDPTSAFSGYATQLGLNVATFDSCLSSEKYKDEVDADLELATKVGASGTPTFFVNGERIVGAQPYSAFQAAIDAATN